MRAWLLAPAAAAGAMLGWQLHRAPPAPTLELSQAVQLRELQLGRFAFDRREGPVRVVERWRSPAAPGCPPVDHERVVERATVETTKRADTVQERAQEAHQLVSVTPAPAGPPRPSWSIGLGAQLVPRTALQLELGHQLVGPIWAQAWLLQPLELAAPAAGVGLRVDW